MGVQETKKVIAIPNSIDLSYDCHEAVLPWRINLTLRPSTDPRCRACIHIQHVSLQVGHGHPSAARKEKFRLAAKDEDGPNSCRQNTRRRCRRHERFQEGWSARTVELNSLPENSIAKEVFHAGTRAHGAVAHQSWMTRTTWASWGTHDTGDAKQYTQHNFDCR